VGAAEYAFVERWTVPGFSPDEVWPVLADARLLPAWWRGVFLEAEALGTEAEPVVGGRARVKARGFLPYTLSFVLEATALEPGRLGETRTVGDFEGTWRATLSSQGEGTRVDIDWRVTVRKPLVRLLSPVLRPLFAWNHRWTTPRGEAGLRAFLAQRAGGGPGAPGQTGAPAPPPPRGPW
jgi:hypothetical protein